MTTRLITLVRHAHAEDAEPGIDDFERRLDKRGRHEAEDMAELAVALKLRPDHLVTSPAVRTVSTAKAFAQAFGFPLAHIRHDDRIYLARRPMLAEILCATPAQARHVLLVGHNPAISRLAAWLVGDDALGEFRPATMCTLAARVDAWEALGEGLCERRSLRYPGDRAD
jgi:phosphohistidine phosphatase